MVIKNGYCIGTRFVMALRAPPRSLATKDKMHPFIITQWSHGFSSGRLQVGSNGWDWLRLDWSGGSLQVNFMQVWTDLCNSFVLFAKQQWTSLCLLNNNSITFYGNDIIPEDRQHSRWLEILTIESFCYMVRWLKAKRSIAPSATSNLQAKEMLKDIWGRIRVKNHLAAPIVTTKPQDQVIWRGMKELTLEINHLAAPCVTINARL